MSISQINLNYDQAIILAGGDGVRIKELFPNIPKPLIPFNGIPFIDLLIMKLKRFGIKNIYLSINKKNTPFYEKYNNSTIEIVPENLKLGTGGAIKNIMNVYNLDSSIVLNGDSYCDVSFKDLVNNHMKVKSDLTICAVENKSSRNDAGNINVDKNNKVVSFQEKKNSSKLINSGVYVVNKCIFKSSNDIFSFEEYITQILSLYYVSVFKIDSDVFDFGTPERFKKFNSYINNLMNDL